MCGEPVTARYLREIGTRLCYCDHDCYTDHCKSAVLALTARASWFDHNLVRRASAQEKHPL